MAPLSAAQSATARLCSAERVGSALRLEAAPLWNEARGNVAHITLELVASTTEAAARWRDHELDVVFDHLVDEIVADERTLVERSVGMTTWYVGFNAQLAPFDQAVVRRA